jgi:hypothetical protein
MSLISLLTLAIKALGSPAIVSMIIAALGKAVLLLGR